MTTEKQLGEDPIPVEVGSAAEASIDRTVLDQEIEDIGFQDAAQDLGARLEAARESAKMTVEAAGELLKLLPETILALESGELTETGGKGLIYIEGYYRAYANALGVEIGDTRFAVDHARPIETGANLTPQVNYQATTKQVLTERLRERSDAIILGLAAIMVLVVGGVIWLVWPSSDDIGTNETGVVVTPSDPPQTQSTAAELPFYLRDEPAQAPETGASANTLESNRDERSDLADSSVDLSVDAELGITTGALATEPTPTSAPPVVQSANPLSEFNLVPGTAVASQDRGLIEITFRGPSWVEVYGADDARLYYKMGQAGEVASLVGLVPFTLRIGDASVVTVRFNESEIDLAPYTFGNVANLTVQ